MRSGQVDAGRGFGHWLIKFDGVAGNRDKEAEDGQSGYAFETQQADQEQLAASML